MPLPSQSVGHWIYGEHSALPELCDRQTYLQRIAPMRVEHIRARIHEHRPKAVIFYSQQYRAWWEQITCAPFEAPIEPGIRLLKTGDTVFVMTRHPVYRGITTDYFVEAGGLVAAALRA